MCFVKKPTPTAANGAQRPLTVGAWIGLVEKVGMTRTDSPENSPRPHPGQVGPLELDPGFVLIKFGPDQLHIQTIFFSLKINFNLIFLILFELYTLI